VTTRRVILIATVVLLGSLGLSAQEVQVRVEGVDANSHARVQDPDIVLKPVLPGSSTTSEWEKNTALEYDRNHRFLESSKKWITPGEPGMSSWLGSPAKVSAVSNSTSQPLVANQGTRTSTLQKLANLQRASGGLLVEIESKNLKLGSVSEEGYSDSVARDDALGQKLRRKLVTAKRASMVGSRMRSVKDLIHEEHKNAAALWENNGLANANALNERRSDSHVLLKYGYGERLEENKEKNKESKKQRKAREARRNKAKAMRHN